MKVIVCGDYFPYDFIKAPDKAVFDDGSFGNLPDILSEADYSVVNYESAVAAASDSRILKDGPALRSGEEAVVKAKELGFDCFALANNHSLDYGASGLSRTLGLAAKYGIDTVGAGKDSADAARTLYKNISGKTLAIVNCCEREFSVTGLHMAGAHHIDPIEQFREISEARSKSDHVIVITHSGAETCRHPSPRMQKTFRFFIDAGADAVINHHQHCFCGYEVYRGAPIFYGLGNFFFPEEGHAHDDWNRGYFVTLDLSDSGTSFSLTPYIQCAGDNRLSIITDDRDFRKEIQSLNEVISDAELLEKEYLRFADANASSYLKLLLPHVQLNESRRIRMLKKLHLLNDGIFATDNVYKLNCLRCESHLERMIRALENVVYGNNPH